MSRLTSLLSRRRFLQKACAAGAALAATQLCSGLLPAAAIAYPVSIEQRTKLLMGTFVTLSAPGADAARARDAMERAFTEMERLVAVFDRHTGHSALGILNAQGSLADAPPELCAVLTSALRGASITTAFIVSGIMMPLPYSPPATAEALLPL